MLGLLLRRGPSIFSRMVRHAKTYWQNSLHLVCWTNASGARLQKLVLVRFGSADMHIAAPEAAVPPKVIVPKTSIVLDAMRVSAGI